MITPTRLNRAGSRRRAEAGFTLVELIITIVILGVITIPLGNVVLAYFKHTADTTARLSASHDVQIATAYFAQDIASMGTRSGGALSSSLWVTPFTSAPSCGAGLGVRILLIASDDYSNAISGSFDSTAAPQVDYIAYVSEGSASPYTLHRIRCVGAASTSDVTIAHNLNALPGFPKCDGASCSAASAHPQQVELDLVLKDSSSPTSTYPVALIGQRRQSS